MKDVFKKIAERKLKLLLEMRELNKSSENTLPKTMETLCDNLQLFYQVNSISPKQFMNILEAYLEELKEII